MALDPVRDEQEREEYERQYNADKAADFEKYKQAVEMCIAAGYLKREKFNEALAFVGAKVKE